MNILKTLLLIELRNPCSCCLQEQTGTFKTHQLTSTGEVESYISLSSSKQSQARVVPG